MTWENDSDQAQQLYCKRFCVDKTVTCYFSFLSTKLNHIFGGTSEMRLKLSKKIKSQILTTPAIAFSDTFSKQEQLLRFWRAWWWVADDSQLSKACTACSWWLIRILLASQLRKQMVLNFSHSSSNILFFKSQTLRRNREPYFLSTEWIASHKNVLSSKTDYKEVNWTHCFCSLSTSCSFLQ